MNWQEKAACLGRPPEWWVTGDPGNRLALALCRIACPVAADCAAAERAPHGVIRGGVAYANGYRPGVVVPLCACGRPCAPHGVEAGTCWQCAPPAPHIRLRRPGRPRKRPLEVVTLPTAACANSLELPHAA